MESSLGVKSPSRSQIMIVSSPVGPYYPTGFNPVSLLCETKYIRSAPGGTGGFKLGG
jgi:branched-chain amino acid aminotransferase